MKTSYTILTNTNNNEAKFMAMPKWKRSVILMDNGDIYVPAGMVDNEDRLLLIAGFDGVPVIFEFHHLYMPITWLEKEYPKWQDVFDAIKKTVGEAGCLE